MSTTVRPRWGLVLGQVGLVIGGSVVWLVLAVVSSPGRDAATAAAWGLALGTAVLAGVLALEVVKTRAIAAAGRSTANAEPEGSEGHAASVRRLTESRRAIVEAFEIERARIERDLHDGAQQYLVAASMKVGEAAFALERVTDTLAGPDARTASALLAQAQDDTDAALAALRETVAGVHSRLLAEQGLEAAVRDLASRLGRSGGGVVVRVPHRLPDLPPGVASAAWFFVSETLTNAAKHAPGAPVSVVLAADAALHVSVVDDGPGGAEVRPGHGLAGMRERLGAFGGDLNMSSPDGGPTTVAARLPLLLRSGEPGVGRGTREGHRRGRLSAAA